MKKLLIALAFIMPVALAASVSCGGVSVADYGPLAIDSGTLDYSVWTAGGFACTVGDKTFSNFDPGESPHDTAVRIKNYMLDGSQFHSVVFSAFEFKDGFTITYDIAVDPASPWTITRVSADLAGVIEQQHPYLLKQVYSTSDELLGATAAYVGTTAPNPSFCVTYQCSPLYLSPGQTTLHIVDTFVPQGGTADVIGNGFLQTVPEPATMALIGAGLLTLAVFRRRT